MFDHWSDEVNLKKAYVGVTNVLESNPNAYIWAGRDFHQRPQQGINDYFWMNHDGQGAGVKNFDIGGVQFDVAAVSQVKSCSPEVMADETNPSRITCTGSLRHRRQRPLRADHQNPQHQGRADRRRGVRQLRL